MPTIPENRNRVLNVRLTPSEFNIFNEKWRQSTCRNLSDYARRMLFQKPLVKTHRNVSLDDAMKELMELRKVLNGVANNFNQAVKRLHTIDTSPELRIWLNVYAQDNANLIAQIEQIKARINSISDTWLQ